MATNGIGDIHRMNLPTAVLGGLRQAVKEYPGITEKDKPALLEALTPREGSPPADPNKPHRLNLGDLLEEWDTYALRVYEARQGNLPLGIKTGLPKVDRELGEVFQPGLHSIHANTGVGKTAFALQVAATCGFPALYVTCEMAPLELLRRIAARVTGEYLGRFKSGEYHPDKARELARQAIATCPDLAILDSTRGYVPAFGVDHRDTMNLFDQAEAVRGDSPHLLVVIDSLHSWASQAAGDSPEYEALNSALVSLTSLAAALKCPVLYISEMNRGSMRTGQGGGVNSGAGTRKIEYLAESVIELTRHGDTPDVNEEYEVTLKLTKNRNGTIGRPVDLRFCGALQRYREV